MFCSQRHLVLKGLILVALTAQVMGALAVDQAGAGSQKIETNSSALLSTPPSLQIPAPTSMGVVWGVTARATGFVDFGQQPDLSDAQRVFAGHGGLRALDKAVLGVRLTGLQPATLYYYRTGTVPIDFQRVYKIVPGEPHLSEIHTFRTPGLDAPSTFAVINDTHGNQESFALLAAKVESLEPAVTIWNGDVCNSFDTMPQMIQIVLNPGQSKFAVNRPFLFNPGNHDYRGILARELPRILLTREPTERANIYWTLERNYAYRQGEIALIGLDTGESNPDDHINLGQLAQFTAYRELQAQWLAETFERPEIREAPYIVVFCHMPMLHGAKARGGIAWRSHHNDLWSPLFERYGVQLVIAGHNHRFRYDAPNAQCSWTQVVGGTGCDLSPRAQLTVIEGRVVEGSLQLIVHNLTTGTALGEYSFKPRSTRSAADKHSKIR